VVQERDIFLRDQDETETRQDVRFHLRDETEAETLQKQDQDLFETLLIFLVPRYRLFVNSVLHMKMITL